MTLYRSPSAATYCGSGIASTAWRSAAIARPYAPRAASACDERVEAVGVVGEDPEREAELALGVGDPPVAEVELAELDVCPGGRLCGAGGGVDRELHRLDRGGRVADQLAAVGDARVGGEARAEPVHRVKCLESLWVAAELDVRVADHAERPGRVGVELARLLPEREGVAEAVAGERQRAEPADGEVVLRVEGDGAAQHVFGARVPGGIARLARPLLVGEPEQRVRVLVLRVRA